MQLPNGDRAFVDVRKLRDYCLSERHPEGRHKARVFRAALGPTANDAQLLLDAVLDAARTGMVASTSSHEYGQRFVIDFEMRGPSGPGWVRSAWLIRHGEDFPRLTTCHVR